MINVKTILGAAVLSLGMTAGAQAVMLDFSGVQGFHLGTLSVPGTGGGPGATINHSSPGGTIQVGSGAAGETDGFCFLGIGCQADGELVFDSAIMNLTFDIDGAQPGDSVEISAFNGAALLASFTLTDDGNYDWSSVGTITRLVFDDSSTAAGVGYSTFTYNAVPVPAALPLMAAGVAALGIAGYRRRR